MTTPTSQAFFYEYHVAWSQDDDLFIGRVTEFPLLAAHGETLEEALTEIKTVVCHVLDEMSHTQDPAPEPLSPRDVSGKFHVHLPQALHRELVSEAARQGVSLNTLIVSKLASTQR